MRWILLSMFSIGVLLLLPELAFADNCSSPADCWATAAGGAATAAGLGGGLTIFYLRKLIRVYRRLPTPPEVWRRLPSPPGIKVDVDIDIDVQLHQKPRQETLGKGLQKLAETLEDEVLLDRQKRQEERLTKLFDRLAQEQRPRDQEIW